MQENKAFIDLLNAEPATPRHWENILPAMERGLWQFWPPQSIEAQNLFRQYMREWIESGFQEDGSEEREKRTYVTWGGQAIFESLKGLLNSSLVIMGPEREKLIFGLQANNQRQSPLRGSLRFMFDRRGGLRADPVVFRGNLKPEELAAMAFLYFWNSDQLFTIMRCVHCGVYEISRKARKSYKRGWYCALHRNSASAMSSTAEIRKSHRAKWFSLAVAAYREYETKPRRAKNDRVLFIRDQVNDHLPTLDKIKRNTITRNLAKIQVAAEGRNHNAKG